MDTNKNNIVGNILDILNEKYEDKSSAQTCINSTCCFHKKYTKCCWCFDKRNNHNMHDNYVDGKGIVKNPPQNKFYCPNCKFQDANKRHCKIKKELNLESTHLAL